MDIGEWDSIHKDRGVVSLIIEISLLMDIGEWDSIHKDRGVVSLIIASLLMGTGEWT